MVYIYEVQTFQVKSSLNVYSGVLSVSWSPDATKLVSGSRDRTVPVCVWEASTGKQLSRMMGNMGDVLSVAWSPDGKQLVSGSEDKEVRLWESTQTHTFYIITLT